MNTFRSLLTALLLVLTGNMFGDELVIQDFTIMPGETKEVSIELNNPENPYILLEFEVIFPEGVSIAKDEDDEMLVELNSSRIAKSHTLEVADHGGGKYKFLSYSSKNAAFKGTSGEIISVTLKAADNAVDGEYQGKITGQLFSKVDETGYYPEDKSFKVIVKGEENITVTAKDHSRLYGEENPAFDYTVEGGTLDGSPKISCEATANSPVGTYPIVVSKGTETNGSVTYVAGTLTIEKAPLTISGGTYTMKQGDALPELKAEYEGFKNGETEAVLIKKPTLTTIATSSSKLGVYEVTVSGAEAQNYEINYKSGKITVTESDAAFISRLESIKNSCQKSREELEKYKMRYYDIEEYEEEGSREVVRGFYDKVNKLISELESIISRCEEKISKGEEISQQDRAELEVENGYSSTLIRDMMGYIFTITISCNGGGQIRTWMNGYYGRSIIRNETKTLYWLYDKFLVIYERDFGVNDNFKHPDGGDLELIVEPDEGYIAMVNGKQVSANTHLDTWHKEKCEVSFIKSPEDEITLTATNYTREYGESNPSFDYTVSGGTLNGTPQISCVATQSSSVGTYTIIIEKGSVTNSNVSFVNGTLTITKAPLTISGGAYTMKQGDVLPELKAEYEGFKNGETESVLIKKPTLSTTATSSSAHGEYEVTVADAEAQNYEISYKPGKITVTQTVGIETVGVSGNLFNIYSLQGKVIRKNAKDLNGLPKGIYIVNGGKIVVK